MLPDSGYATAESSKTTSTKSSRSSQSLGSLVPTVWRWFVLLIRRNGSAEEMSNKLSPNDAPKEQYIISGAYTNDELCRVNPHQSPYHALSCRKHTGEIYELRNKPLPQIPVGAKKRPPDLDIEKTRRRDKPLLPLRFAESSEESISNSDIGEKSLPPTPSSGIWTPDSNRTSFFNTSLTIASFKRDVDTSFLWPLERQILQMLRELSGDSNSPSEALVQLGSYEFAMSYEDANTLEQITILTETLSAPQKLEVVKTLDPLIKPEHRYPLRQVLQFGAKVKSSIPRPSTVDGIDDVIELYLRTGETVVEFEGENLMPAPLNIPQRREVRRLSLTNNDAASECNIPASPTTSEQPPSSASPPPQSTQKAAKVAGSVRNALANLPRRTHSLSPREALNPVSSHAKPPPTPKPTCNFPKTPGSVRRARLAALDALASKTSSTSNSPIQEKQPAANCPKLPGSVRRARQALLRDERATQSFMERRAAFIGPVVRPSPAHTPVLTDAGKRRPVSVRPPVHSWV